MDKPFTLFEVSLVLTLEPLDLTLCLNQGLLDIIILLGSRLYHMDLLSILINLCFKLCDPVVLRVHGWHPWVLLLIKLLVPTPLIV